MTSIAQLSNVDLLKEYGTGVFLGWPDGEGDYFKLRTEILRRMDAGIKHRDDVAVEPSEHQR